MAVSNPLDNEIVGFPCPPPPSTSKSKPVPRRASFFFILLVIVLVLLLACVNVAAAGTDLYSVLGISRDATKRQIKKAYKDLSKIHHPDKTGGDDAKFIDLAHAYEILSNDEKRRVYDQYGEEGLKDSAGGSQFHDPFDIFSQFGFGGGGSHRQTEKKGPKINLNVDVTLKELYLGTEIDVEINRQVICPKCRGSGAKNVDDVKTCTSCSGSGIRIIRHQLAPGFIQQMQATCDACNGKGKVVSSTCPHCGGKKIKRGNHQFSIQVEKGMQDGEQLIFEQEGDEDPEQTSGDVIITLKMVAHSVFVRKGHNLYMKEIVSLKESLVGFKRNVERLDASKFSVSRSGVTPHGFVNHIRGEGMPKSNILPDNGDLFIEYVVVWPEKPLTKAQVEQLDKVFPGKEGDNHSEL